MIRIAAVMGGCVLSLVATLLLAPLWSWFESVTGIESIGHSGPAGWCYLFMMLVGGATGLLLTRRRAD